MCPWIVLMNFLISPGQLAEIYGFPSMSQRIGSWVVNIIRVILKIIECRINKSI